MKAIRMILTLSLFCCKLFASTFSESGNTPWGYDDDLIFIKQEKPKDEKLKQSIGQKTCRGMIRFFQVYISPIDGPRSSYYPTSSQYALEAIQKHGILKGIGMGCDRLLRENGEVWVYETTDRFGPLRKLDPVQ
jgi:uncharacterized protein